MGLHNTPAAALFLFVLFTCLKKQLVPKIAPSKHPSAKLPVRQRMYSRVPLYRCTSMYIGRGQVLFQKLFLTYFPPILGRSDDEICA